MTTRELGIVLFISALVLLVAGYLIVSSRVGSRRASLGYLIYRVVPMSGFFGAFGLGLLSNPNAPGGITYLALLAAAQTAVIMVILHVFIGHHLRE
jgi:hypothetical protein